MISTVKRFSTVNEAEVDVFLEFPCFLYDPTSVGNLISGSSAFSKPRLYIWKFLVHVLLKPRLKGFEHNLTSMGNEYNCAVVLNILSHSPYLGLEWKLTFSSPVATAEFSKFPDLIEWSTLIASSYRILNSSAEIPSPPLALLVVMLPKAHLLHTPGCLALGEWPHAIYLVYF